MPLSSTTSDTCSETDLSTLAKTHDVEINQLRELTKRAIAAKETAYCA